FAYGWPAQIAAALDEAVATLEQRTQSADPRAWAWGRLRPLVLKHPLGRSWLLAPIFDLGPVPSGGDTDTINHALTLPFARPPPTVAAPRTVIDVGAWSNPRFALPGGQSGNPFSPHYADQLPLWQRGEGVPIPWTPDEVAACRTVLTLVPASV